MAQPLGSFVLGESVLGGAVLGYANTSTLQEVIPSYLYVEYNDDEDLQAFVTAFNAIAQQYVDFFNQINLPIYTSSSISGALLDWVAQGIYGMTRPSLPGAGSTLIYGPFNTYAFNKLAFNQRK